MIVIGAPLHKYIQSKNIKQKITFSGRRTRGDNDIDKDNLKMQHQATNIAALMRDKLKQRCILRMPC